MGTRSKRAERCSTCRMHLQACLCAGLPRLALQTRVVLVMHHKEDDKTTATGPLALACLTNSERRLHGLRDAALDLRTLHEEGRRVLLLFPAEGARPISAELLAEDPRPVTLVVPDGNWGQARRIPRRVPGLGEAECVTLPDGPPSAWGVRFEPVSGGLSTFEAIARALGALESRQAQAALESVFERMVEATLGARGQAGRIPELRQASSDALPVVYQDEHLIAVNKPAGLPSHRGWAQDVRPALQRVRDQVGRIVYPIHRLDRATSGLLLFAFSPEVVRDMQEILSAVQTAKRYLALCRGCDPALVHVDHPLSKEPGQEKRPAQTDFRLLGAFERYGLYEARPRTGRTHQIRRHLKHVAHPIIGDVRYGKGDHNRLFRDRYGFHRLALHCHRFHFTHPRTGRSLDLVAPLPDEFSALLSELALLQAAELAR